MPSTTHYPVQQAITAPQASLSRGDWGLKRGLPLQAARNTTTPIIRINALDTIEHITDYQSAADLSLTLNKIQELALPISSRPQRLRASIFSESKSVFEAETDHTDPTATKKDPKNRRWKFQGPWLAGMQEGDFVRFVAKSLRGRKAEFAAFLREHHAQMSETNRRQENREMGRDLEAAIDSKAEQDSFREWMKELRSGFAIESELSRLITRFLDLPESSMSASTRGSFGDVAQQVSDKGPPRTHPSAGLSYLKTNAVIPNHPIFGPQAQPQPVQARVLRTKSSGARETGGKLGIAGVVVADGLVNRVRVPQTFDEDIDQSLEGKERQGSTVGIATPGGNRIWVNPVRAHIDEEGRVLILANSADTTAVGVHTGNLALPTVMSQSARPRRRLDILSDPSKPSKRPVPATVPFDIVSQLEKTIGKDKKDASLSDI